MNANLTAAPVSLPEKSVWRFDVEETHPLSRYPMTRPAALLRTETAIAMTNVMVYVGLWMSLLAAIWLTKSWIGLLFSGQMLSVGACLFQILAKRTHYAFSTSNGPARQLKGGRNE